MEFFFSYLNKGGFGAKCRKKATSLGGKEGLSYFFFGETLNCKTIFYVLDASQGRTNDRRIVLLCKTTM